MKATKAELLFFVNSWSNVKCKEVPGREFCSPGTNGVDSTARNPRIRQNPTLFSPLPYHVLPYSRYHLWVGNHRTFVQFVHWYRYRSLRRGSLAPQLITVRIEWRNRNGRWDRRLEVRCASCATRMLLHGIDFQ